MVMIVARLFLLVGLLACWNNHLVESTDSVQYSCRIIGDEERMDCHPADGATESECQRRGCCWSSPISGINGNIPYCFFPQGYPGYQLESTEFIQGGIRYNLRKSQRSFIPDEYMELVAELTYVAEDIIRLRITDPDDSRFQVPYVFNVTPIDTPINHIFDVQVNSDPFAVMVSSKLTGEKILDTSVGPLFFADQFLEISSSLPNNYVYGLGEHRNPLRVDAGWQTIPFWNRDQPPVINHNLYGSQPMLMAPGAGGRNYYGMFMLNANAMEVILQPTPSITYRTIGGIIDLFVYGGPTPQEVTRQHWTVVQFPHFQPYWALGFHLCRYGYVNIDNMRAVMNRMKEANFQYDVQWTDIDAMRERLVFTYDDVNWPGLPELVRELHESDMKYTPINDPCIGLANLGTYPALDAGLGLDVFIRSKNGERLIGRVWPGDCYFPDFTSANAVQWWSEEIRKFNETAPFDGFWIDMNEPANFVPGSTTGCFDDDPLDNPWYVPKVIGGTLYDKTVCPSAKQVMSTMYNLHNLYALIETKVTLEAIDLITPTKRHFVLSRATFAGSGHYAGHWSGDNWSTWNDLYYSIPEILNFQFYGMPFVGADICGFFENTTEELCMRWMQLGAFYPFMRNHNTINVVDQDPAVFSDAATYVMHQALLIRYTLMPYWYTLSFQSHDQAHVILNPMFYLWPEDTVCQRLDTQFFVGESLLVIPVIVEGSTSMLAYFPSDNGDPFYNYYSQKAVDFEGWVELPVTAESLPLYWRAGRVIPTHIINETMNAIQNRNSMFRLLVTASHNGPSVGMLYWDDGESKEGANCDVSFTYSGNYINFHRHSNGYTDSLMLSEVVVMGQAMAPQAMLVNGVAHNDWSCDGDGTLTITNLNMDMLALHDSNIEWSPSANQC